MGASPLQMVSAFASETRLTLGQIAVEAREPEQVCLTDSMHSTPDTDL